MRREVTPAQPSRQWVDGEPPHGLSDGVVTVRLPLDEDVERLVAYGRDPELLAGAWVVGPQPGWDLYVWARWVLGELCSGWTAAGGILGGGLIVDEGQPFVGLLGFIPRGPGCVELSYGVLPTARGRGIATRMAKLGSRWALGDAGFERVELRIDPNHVASHRVAEKAGFRFEEVFSNFIEGTGETVEDRLYVRDRRE